MSGKRSYDVANGMFGFNGWKTELKECKIDTAEETLNGKFTVFVTSTIRVTIKDGTYCEVTGYGQSHAAYAKHVALSKARKHAITDAKKRALQKFGILDQLMTPGNNESYRPVEFKNESSDIIPPFKKLNSPHHYSFTKREQQLQSISADETGQSNVCRSILDLDNRQERPSKLFKNSEILDLTRTTFNTPKDLLFIKHKSISQLSIVPPCHSSASSTAHTEIKIKVTIKPHEKQSSSSINSMAPPSITTTIATKSAASFQPPPKLENENNNALNHTKKPIIKAEDPNQIKVPSDNKAAQVPIIPDLSSQDSFSFEGEEKLFAELIKVEEKEQENSLMDDISDDFLRSISTQALIDNL